MEKDFIQWHVFKSNINGKSEVPLFQEREVWWCSIGINVGVEEDGKNDFFERPVLVFLKFNKDMFWGFPMTSVEKYGHYNHQLFFRGKKITVLLSQLRIFSAKRLLRPVGRLSKKKFCLLADSFLDIIQKDKSRH